MQNIGFEFNKKVFWNLHNDIAYKASCSSLRDGETRAGVKIKKGLADITFADIRDGVEIVKQGTVVDPAFTLEIAWPGLYSGLGYTHETGKNDEEFKTGFSFHYLTGVPFIPESGVKGILRSSFPMRYKNNGKRAAVEIALNDILKILFPDKVIDLEKLELEIFGPATDDDPKTSPVGRVRFGCAIPSASNVDTVKIFSIDTITPHDHPLKEPVPLRTLAMRPGVKMDFFFVFNTTASPVLRDTEIRSLFEYLITAYGAGAKTNSGYGQFVKETPNHVTQDEGYLDFLTIEPAPNRQVGNGNFPPPGGAITEAPRPAINVQFVHPPNIKKGVEVLTEFVKVNPVNPKEKIFKIISPCADGTEVKLSYQSSLQPESKHILRVADFNSNQKKISAVNYVKEYKEI